MQASINSYEYFDWLIGKLGKQAHRYSKLLDHLFSTEFTYTIPMDENRWSDGVYLRNEFLDECGGVYILNVSGAPCSVLEMMIALSIRCERILEDELHDNRTEKWFWNMIQSLQLKNSTDQNYDEQYVDDRLFIFMHRMYEWTGRGGLFTLDDPDCDMRELQIWDQMNMFISEYWSRRRT